MAPSSNPPREITVVAAVIRDKEGRVLLAQRPEGRHMGGLWEFPGGKIDDGEAPSEALVRELDEELGTEIVVQRPLTFAVHEEPGLRILLLFYGARIARGEPQGHEGQAVEWATRRRRTDSPVDERLYPLTRVAPTTYPRHRN